jgi:hypothetical protein
MNTEREFAYKVRHYLNQGTDEVDRKTADRLFSARQNALAHQKVAGAQLSLAGVGHVAADVVLPYARTLIALVGLAIGVAGVSVWNEFEKAAEHEEVDSALLADDLPINAYLDRGFQAWLSEHFSED